MFEDFLSDPKVKFDQPLLKKVVQDYNFLDISVLDENKKNRIYPNIKESEVIIID